MALRIKPISLPDLAHLDAGGEPRLLPIGSIDEDPDQPRTEFDGETLAQLAETIRFRGVRSPVSVRPHPSDPARWILNFGARRLRASKLAGRMDIPAFVDETFDGYDQVIENEQREGLKPLEIALFIKRQLDRGQSRIDIARGIGKSPSYVTVASALIDAPDWLLDAYRSGKCRGIFELCELRRLHEQDGAAVQTWLADVDFVGRAELRRFRIRVGGADGFASGRRDRAPGEANREVVAARATRSGADRIAPEHLRSRSSGTKSSALTPAFEPFKSGEGGVAPRAPQLLQTLVVEAEHDGRRVRVVLDELPPAPATVYVVAEDGGRVVTGLRSLDKLVLVRATKPQP